MRPLVLSVIDVGLGLGAEAQGSGGGCVLIRCPPLSWLDLFYEPRWLTGACVAITVGIVLGVTLSDRLARRRDARPR